MTGILIMTVLLLGNGFFVGAEFALIASRRTVLAPMAESSRRARWALTAMGQIPLMIAGAQLGIQICSILLGAIAEPAIAHLLETPFELVNLPEQLVHPVSFVIALTIVVYLHTVLGEMVPKNITLAGPEASVVWLGPPMLLFCTVTKPLLVVMKWLSRRVLKLWRIDAVDSVKSVFTAEELAGLVTQARSEGLLDPEQHARISGALAMHQRTAGDALRPWAEVDLVTDDTSPASLEVLATRTGRSRFPVVQRLNRRVLGFVHIKDVIGMSGAARRAPIPSDVIRPLAIVPPERSLAELLLAMRRERRHMVLVSDGQRPIGVVTLDDVLAAVSGR
ncbi:MAG: HlyC/CorC family transporter [Hamadaea sp.]|uniref:hemolysin family protein n=1 Tax=Hamadaea sp. TaxID=2024425 RepID=UPI001847805B|nr:hemolysin family protein [Hamadaea sp.]NUR74641.1 HlyC/CorC family transporter [Hamadaea sp.]NUT21149.1 HlyC/CorC family transporter [Hamadaea sp.]